MSVDVKSVDNVLCHSKYYTEFKWNQTISFGKNMFFPI